MRLIYRGQAYTAETPAVEGVEIQEQATFLGKTYNRKSIRVSQQQQPAQELQFLGRRYTR